MTGSTILWEFINPISLAMLMSLYGVEAILIRDLRIKYSLSYRSILLMGFAYGIVEEGLAVKSFFNPHWKDLGMFGTYGRWLGVNWVWSIYLIVFHGVFSMFAPIIMVEALYPDIARERLICSKTMVLAIIVFLSDVVTINLLTKYQPSVLHYMFSLIAIILFVALAFRIHSVSHAQRSYLIKTCFRYGVYRAVWSAAFFLCFCLVSSIIPISFVLFVLGVFIAYTSLKLADKLEQPENHCLDRYFTYLGIITPLLLMDFLLALRPDIERFATITIIVASIAAYKMIRNE